MINKQQENKMNKDYYNVCKVKDHLAGNPSLEVVEKWMEKNTDKVEVDDMGNILNFKTENVHNVEIFMGTWICIKWDNVVYVRRGTLCSGCGFLDDVVATGELSRPQGQTGMPVPKKWIDRMIEWASDPLNYHSK